MEAYCYISPNAATSIITVKDRQDCHEVESMILEKIRRACRTVRFDSCEESLTLYWIERNHRRMSLKAPSFLLSLVGERELMLKAETLWERVIMNWTIR